MAEEAVLPEESVVQTGREIKSANHKTINQSVLAEEAVLPEESIVKTGNEIKSEMSSNLVRQIQNHEDIVVANQKTAIETQAFNNKNEMQSVPSHQSSVNSQDIEIFGNVPAKNLYIGSSKSKEQLKASESMQVVENFKANEGSQNKASISDMEEFTSEAKTKVFDGFQISEKDKSASESQSLIRPKVSDASKLTERLKITGDLHGQAQGKGSEGR